MAEKISMTLSSPSSALLLNELYDKDYRYKEYSDEVESALGAVLYKKSESIDSYNGMSELVDEYVQFDMQKFFKLSITDYLELNNYTRKVYINKAVDIINKLNSEMEQLKSKNNDIASVTDFNEFEV